MSAQSAPLTERKYYLPFVLVTSLFFMWAIGVNLNDVLIPHLKKAFELSDFESSFIQVAFFGGYFLAAFPAGWLMEKIGYKGGIVLGLLICATGTLLFLPAANSRIYAFFLFALFVMSSGQSFLEVGANPYVTVLGPPASSERRLNFAQSFNAVGAVLVPLLGSAFILSGVEYTHEQRIAMTPQQLDAYIASEANMVKIPYMIITALFLAVAAMIYFAHLPEVKPHESEAEETHAASAQESEKITRPPDITLFAVLELLTAAYVILVGFGSLLGITAFRPLLSWFGGAGHETFIAVLLLLSGALSAVSGVGLFMQKNWARMITMVCAAVDILFGSIGVILSVVDFNLTDLARSLAWLIMPVLIIWYLSRPRMKQVFGVGPGSVESHPHLVKGVIAQFFYVGAQVGVGSFVIRFTKHTMPDTLNNIAARFAGTHIGEGSFLERLQAHLTPNNAEKAAALFLVAHQFGFMIGRFSGSAIMKRVPAPKLLSLFGIGALICVAVGISAPGLTSVLAIVLVGFFNSIQFPTIFALSLKNLGTLTKRGSSLLVMSIIGGALIPAVMGRLSDLTNIRVAFIWPLICYAYVTYFALRGYKTTGEVAVGEEAAATGA